MSLPEPVRAFCRVAAAMVPRTRRTPWGVVIADRRFPLVWDATNDEVLDQMVARTREVFVPAGLRCFVAFVDEEMAGYTSYLSLAGVGYIDNVVTMPAFRGRGLGTATVIRAMEASHAGADRCLFLL